MLQWLHSVNLDVPEIISCFQQNQITLDNMKYLKDADLLSIGIKDWGTRISILEAINKYYCPYIPMMDMQTAAGRQPSYDSMAFEAAAPAQADSLKRKLDPSTTAFPNKKPKLNQINKKRIRFKDLDVLVNDSLIPVEIGSTVMCEGSNTRGTVVLNKQKKPTIEYLIRGKKCTGTIAQYFKAATGEPLQAKGESWTKIFFTDPTTNSTRSLADLKYLIKGPKKAVSAFLWYSKEIRDELPKTADFAKRSGDMWKNLPEDRKQKYKIKEMEDKERFNREKMVWTMLTTQLQQEKGITDLSGSLIGTAMND
eukprot:TRINITY_DN4553_c0_g1_i3.p1 TRINITY_DN4553_c0_g1~~TRINITY_DN4553_c0_g1_i3.p1  ORF type:complete len:310 (-),score=47.70 TRINITY_DN4553_c0_g1_i3:43-972(-)